MSRALRIAVVLLGVACFVAAAAAAFGWLPRANPTGLALVALACWLASTLP